jgi:hypothetical protein
VDRLWVAEAPGSGGYRAAPMLGVRPAGAVVPGLDVQRLGLDEGFHPRPAGVRVLDDVGQRLGDDEVGARLDLRWESRRPHVDLRLLEAEAMAREGVGEREPAFGVGARIADERKGSVVERHPTI